MKKRIISVILTLSMLISVSIPAAADTEDKTKREYYTATVQFVDEMGYDNSEACDFMVQSTEGKNIKVYIKAEDFAMFTGLNGYAYDQTYTECAYVDRETAHVVRFLFGSTNVSVMYAGAALEYNAPYDSLYEDDVAWIPFDFAAKLFDCTYSAGGGTLSILSEGLNPLSAATSIHNKMRSLAFDWVDEAGLSELDAFINTKSATVATAASNLLSFESGTWASVLGCVVGYTYAYDAEYAEQIAQLFIAPSVQEVESMTDNSKSVSDYVNTYKNVGKDLLGADDFIEDLLRKEMYDSTFTKLASKTTGEFFTALEKVADGIDKKFPRVMLGNKVTDLNLKSAKLLHKFASDDTILKIYDKYKSTGKKAVVGLKLIFAVLDVWNYYLMYANKSERATAALGQYADDSQRSETKVFAEYAATTDNELMDAVKRYALDHIDDLINDGVSMGLPAEIMGFAWDMISGYVPFVKDALDSAESNVISQYAIRYQNESLACYYDTRSEFIAGGGKGEDGLDSLVNSVYAYLKFSYIARNAAAASYEHIEKMGINEDVMKNNVSILNKNNVELAEYLVAMEKDAFLPSDNISYNKDYDDTKLSESIAAIGAKRDTPPEQVTVPKNEITSFPGSDGMEEEWISEDDAKDLVKDAILRSLSGILDSIFYEIYDLNVEGMYSVSGRATYVITVAVKGTASTDDNRFFVPTDGMRVWMGMKLSDGTYFCYTGLDLLNMTWGSVISSLDEMYVEIEEQMREQAADNAATATENVTTPPDTATAAVGDKPSDGDEQIKGGE